MNNENPVGRQYNEKLRYHRGGRGVKTIRDFLPTRQPPTPPRTTTTTTQWQTV